MQKDFHYDVVYVLAQWAGYSAVESDTIAHSSQYVDDAIHSGVVKFTNGAMFSRVSSAHSAFDLCHNINEIEDQFVWVPFHFLPGNLGLPAGQAAEQDMTDRLICYPNSYVGREMILECLKQKGSRTELHRLGITLHIYADSWAHQGFSGIISKKNQIKNLQYKESGTGIIKTVDEFILKAEDKTHAWINKYLPLGHGAVFTYPDLPYVSEWSFEYEDGRNPGAGTENFMKRNNIEIFIDAANHIYKTLCLFKQGTIPGDIETMFDTTIGLSAEQEQILRKTFTNFTGHETEVRHTDWQREINSHSIPGVDEIPEYYKQGEKSWEYLALGTELDVHQLEQTVEYSDDFLLSDWKLFHDALQIHRTYILNELLPKYGICAV
ncbi:DUF6765 family protein [Propionispira raffinosivorans]|uniref:DUF6765 family protein n=1 Tax=Propionispira raffinosivorans TaxID=86959 RepID=UPI00038152A4|nr:DUF6765 family protein [Propionispira raffinosivorans]